MTSTRVRIDKFATARLLDDVRMSPGERARAQAQIVQVEAFLNVAAAFGAAVPRALRGLVEALRSFGRTGPAARRAL